MESLQGYLTDVKYRRGNFAIGEFISKGAAEQITVVGTLPLVGPDELIEINGEKVNNPTYGEQFQVAVAARVIGTTIEAIRDYLAREIPGVGPIKATAIALRFPTLAELENVLQNHPEQLTKVPGIKELTASRIAKAWRRDRIERQLALFLAKYGISTVWTHRVHITFGGDAVDILKANPYRLMSVPGIGFKRADEMAQKMKWPEDSPERLEASFAYLLDEAANDGHMFIPEELLIQRAARLIGVLPEEARASLKGAIEKGYVAKETMKTKAGDVELSYLPHLLQAEKSIAEDVTCLLQHLMLIDIPIPKSIAVPNGQTPLILTEDQQRAVKNALKRSISILTGGPGTGKTTTIRALVSLAKDLGLKVSLAAPTGRAAKRLSEVSGHEAQTIHRLLEFKPNEGRFGRNKDNFLDADILVVDEFSMVDAELACHLFKAIALGTTVLLIGDPEQLPAVGPGSVLKSLLESRKIETVKLTQVFRQAETSLIVRNAHAIRRGEMPSFPPANAGDLSDSYFIEAVKGKDKQEAWIKTTLQKLIEDRIPDKFKLNPKKQVQVLVPMKGGRAGVNELNVFLRDLINPNGKLVVELSRALQVGDRVMQIVNNYDLNVYNGDIGIIKGADSTEETLTIDFDGQEVLYPYEDAKDLQLAYATTIHKSQGSEYDCVIVVLLRSHYIMLQRQLIYTAATRAKKLIIFLGSRSALEIAVKNNQQSKRNSLLAWRLNH
jgi:exodeoxyribonuclease V alpha subunit